MPFSPLPKTFLEDLHERRHGRVVELGCGDGRLRDLLRAAGAAPVCLDRRPPSAGSVADLVADAGALPFPDGGISFLVAANLLRHLWPRLRPAVVPSSWQRCLARSGRLFILEDEPLAAPAAARHYRDLQVFLHQLAPWGRGPLLPRHAFEQALADVPDSPGKWRLGSQENRWPADPQVVLEMLRGTDQEPRGEAARLTAAISADGLSYGRCWWACWEPEVTR